MIAGLSGSRYRPGRGIGRGHDLAAILLAGYCIYVMVRAVFLGWARREG